MTEHDFQAALDDINAVSGPAAGNYIMKAHRLSIIAALELAIKAQEIDKAVYIIQQADVVFNGGKYITIPYSEAQKLMAILQASAPQPDQKAGA